MKKHRYQLVMSTNEVQALWFALDGRDIDEHPHIAKSARRLMKRVAILAHESTEDILAAAEVCDCDICQTRRTNTDIRPLFPTKDYGPFPPPQTPEVTAYLQEQGLI